MTRYAVYDLGREEFVTRQTYADRHGAYCKLVEDGWLNNLEVVEFTARHGEEPTTARTAADFRKTAGCTLALILIGLSAGVSLGLVAFLIHTGWCLVNWF